MGVLGVLTAQPLVRAVGWALIHSIWIGSVVVLIVEIGLAGGRRSSRYPIVLTGLVALVVGTVVAGIGTYRHIQVGLDPGVGLGWVAGESVGGDEPSPVVVGSDGPASGGGALHAEAWFPWLLPFWMVGVGVQVMRLGLGWQATRRWRTSSSDSLPAPWPSIVVDLRRVAGLVTPIAVRLSHAVRVPMVVGVLHPMVLIPSSCFAGMDADQLRAILLHEFVHIRRRDHLVNALVCISETVLFFNPAGWWLARRLRTEQEEAVDAGVVARGIDHVAYARALVELGALTLDPSPPSLSTRSTGGQLARRVHRLLGAHPSRIEGAAPLGGFSVLTLVVAFLLGASSAVESQAPPNSVSGCGALVVEPSVQMEILERSLALEARGSGAIRRAAGDPDWITRAAAASSAGDVAGAGAAIISLLDDPVAEVRRRSAMEVRPGAGSAVVARLEATAAGAPSGPEAEAALVGLREIDREAATRTARTALVHPCAQVRELAVRILSDARASEDVARLVDALGDDEPQVRAAAATALGDIGDPAALGPLVSLREDPDRQVREAAAAAIADLRSDR